MLRGEYFHLADALDQDRLDRKSMKQCRRARTDNRPWRTERRRLCVDAGR